jgi:hypothetical protein
MASVLNYPDNNHLSLLMFYQIVIDNNSKNKKTTFKLL